MLQSDLDSFEKLELVHQLRAAKRPISRTDLQSGLRIDVGTLRTAITELLGCGLIEEATDEPGSVRLGGRATVDKPLEALMTLYDEDRLTVVAALSSIAMDRIRGMAAHAFADAFVIRRRRKDQDDG